MGERQREGKEGGVKTGKEEHVRDRECVREEKKKDDTKERSDNVKKRKTGEEEEACEEDRAEHPYQFSVLARHHSDCTITCVYLLGRVRG